MLRKRRSFFGRNGEVGVAGAAIQSCRKLVEASEVQILRGEVHGGEVLAGDELSFRLSYMEGCTIYLIKRITIGKS